MRRLPSDVEAVPVYTTGGRPIPFKLCGDLDKLTRKHGYAMVVQALADNANGRSYGARSNRELYERLAEDLTKLSAELERYGIK